MAELLDFEPSTLPWTDRDDFETELAERLRDGRIEQVDAERMLRWRRDGFLRCEKLVDAELCDALLGEYERAWQERPAVDVTSEGLGTVPISAIEDRGALAHHHYRVLDLQDVSEVARCVVLHPDVVRVARSIFDAQPVLMQTLFFEYGSEQALHQDFPYVQAQVLSHLVGCWIALEDVDDENGPLVYHPGSHRIAKFRWSNGGITYDGKDEAETHLFTDHICDEAARLGLRREVLHAKKGDALFWHSALAHGGEPARDRERTRWTIVAHFSTRLAYPRDRRFPTVEPTISEIGGGVLYENPTLRS